MGFSAKSFVSEIQKKKRYNMKLNTDKTKQKRSKLHTRKKGNFIQLAAQKRFRKNCETIGH